MDARCHPEETSPRKSTWRGTREGDGPGEARGSRRWARESQADDRCAAAARRSLPSGSRLSPSAGHAEPASRSDPPCPQPRAHLRADSSPPAQRPHRAPRSLGSGRDPRVPGRWDPGLRRTSRAQKIPTPFPGDQATGDSVGAPGHNCAQLGSSLRSHLKFSRAASRKVKLKHTLA